MNTHPGDVAPGNGSTGGPARAPWWTWGCSAELGAKDIANYRRFFVFCIAWGAALVLAVWSLKRWAEALGPAAYALALVPMVLFVAVIWSYARFLGGADDLTRRIHVEAMAAGFGAGLLFLLGYPPLAIAGAPPLDLNDAVFPMVIAYVFAYYLAQRRYR